MSPLSLRRYRAERLLRSEFDALRSTVLPAVRGRLRGSGLAMDDADLEACYSQAWQGLYAAMLGGEEICNPTGWLVLVTYRRAIDEQRTGKMAVQLADWTAAEEQDFAEEIDGRTRLSQLLQGISVSLTERERQAAALCYLQGLSRAEAAQRMGVGERRMQRLMEGRGPGRPGVAAKVGALIEAISAGRFCEEQASLMRALAFGVLDPEGERHKIAVAHRQSCPACRAYVLSLRGLSAALPPVCLPGLLQGAGLGGAAAGAVSTSGAAPGASSAAAGAGAGASGTGVGIGALKLAATGALLLGAGAGAIALTAAHSHRARHLSSARLTAPTGAPAGASSAGSSASRAGHSRVHVARHARHTVSPRRASASPFSALREFGIERGATAGGSAASGPTPGGGGSASVPPAGHTSSLRSEFGIE